MIADNISWFLLPLVFWDLAAGLSTRVPGHCGCDRHHRPWFSMWHANRWLWGAVVFVLVVGGCVLAVDGSPSSFFVSAPLWLAIGFYRGYGLWLHEKDTRRRIAAKVKGMVRVNRHGRLAVTSR